MERKVRGWRGFTGADGVDADSLGEQLVGEASGHGDLCAFSHGVCNQRFSIQRNADMQAGVMLTVNQRRLEEGRGVWTSRKHGWKQNCR